MTLLPVVGRELAVASRRKATYWSRLLVAGLAVGLFGLVAVFANGSPTELGRELFAILGIPTLLLCSLSGIFVTADCLSVEKREGTLGLLFLTDLNGYDVVLGKMAAQSVNAVFGLLAVFPVLALPLLTGGVSGGEFWRVVLVFCDTLYFSLAIGLLVSAICREGWLAMSLALVILVAVCGLLPLGAVVYSWEFRNHSFDSLCFLPNPAFAYFQSDDDLYLSRTGRPEYWDSVLVMATLATACVAAACGILGRTWREVPSAKAPRFRAVAQIAAQIRRASRPVLRDGDPALWLALGGRRWALSAIIFGLSTFWLGGAALTTLSKAGDFIGVCFITLLGLHLVMKTLVAMESSRRFHFDRQSGALEILLATPLRVSEIVAGQTQALRRQLALPLVALSLANVTTLALLFGKSTFGPSGAEAAAIGLVFCGGVLLLWLDVEALVWLGLWHGLKARKFPRAVSAALGRVLALPWIALFGFLFIVASSRFDISDWGAVFWIAVWIAFGCALDLIWIVSARQKLLAQFRQIVADG